MAFHDNKHDSAWYSFFDLKSAIKAFNNFHDGQFGTLRVEYVSYQECEVCTAL